MKKIGLLLMSAVICLLLVIAGCGTKQTASSSASPSVSAAADSTAPTDSSQKVFTLDELAKYNGQNGAKAYVAVNGVVYDVTNAKNWTNGSHEGHSAGQDLSSVINQAPHGSSVLKDLPVVGKLK